MTVTTTTTAEDVQEQVLGFVRRSQEAAVDAVKQAVEAVNAAAGKLPARPAAVKLPQLPSLSRLPGVSDLPAAETVVNATFDFLDALLADQRKFAGELVKAASGLHLAAKPESEPESEPAGGELATAAE